MVLIEREAAKAKKVYCEERHEYVVPVAELDWLPTITATQVVHGRWVKSPDGYICCSHCGRRRGAVQDRFCGRCGARMDGGEGDEAD